MSFELFQCAFILAVIGVLYIVGNTYERPTSIKRDLIEKLGLETKQEKNEKHIRSMANGDSRRRTIQRV